jgi:hypothetical protein
MVMPWLLHSWKRAMILTIKYLSSSDTASTHIIA